MRVARYSLGMLLIANALGANLLAGVEQAVPEIDAGSISAGLGLLAGAILILRSRRRSK